MPPTKATHGYHSTRDAPPDTRWTWQRLQAAPHRLSFFLAMLVLASSALWWTLLQVERVSGLFGLRYEVAPSVVHATLMSMGFMPLFFAGFLFTAGPKWLGVEPPEVAEIRVPLLAMAIGWLAWPVTSHIHAIAAAAALTVALAGHAAITWRFWRVIRASTQPDRLHAKAIAAALTLGGLALAGVVGAVLADDPVLARAFAQTALWGCVLAVFVTVAHRMIPFFTSSALPMVKAWRPSWLLGMLLAVALFEAAAVWIDMATEAAGWQALRGVVELGSGAVVVWLAFTWGLMQSLKLRLVAMLHLGVSWLGIGLLLMGTDHLAAAVKGEEWLPLGGLHAVTMGFLGSLMLAMVTRVSCGHGGRPLVADNFIWALFWGLQGATLLRIAAAAPTAAAAWLTVTAALAWTFVMTPWALRLGAWYGRPRADGRPG